MSSSAFPHSSAVSRSLAWSFVLSILMILAGFAAILLPHLMGLGVVFFTGWLLLFSGATHLGFAWKFHTAGAVLWELLIGIIYLFAGGYLVIHPLAGLRSLTLILVVYLFLEGVLEIVLSFQVAANRGGRPWLILDGVVTLILALMIWSSWPASTLWAVGILVGVSMLFSGISRLMFALAARRLLQPIS